MWNDKVRLYSIETGECIRDLDDNKDGSIVGLFINPEDKKSLIACTENGTVLTWKLDSNVISNKLVSLSPFDSKLFLTFLLVLETQLVVYFSHHPFRHYIN